MKNIFLILAFVTASLATVGQGVYYNQHPGFPAPVKTNNKNAKAALAPSFAFEWQRADFTGLTMPSTFTQWQLHGGKLVPQVSLTFGLAKVWGAADIKASITTNGDTTLDVRGITYWGFAGNIGFTSLFSTTAAAPSFTTGLIVGINEIALTGGIDWLAKNSAGNISPAIFVGTTANIADLPIFKKTTTITARVKAPN